MVYLPKSIHQTTKVKTSMREAVLAFSRKGQFKEKVCAYDIPSREHARKLWPLVTPETPHQLVTYVSPSRDKKTNKVLRKSHFSRLPRGKRKSVAKQFHEEAAAWHLQRSESTHHRKAKELIAQELTRRLDNSESLVWGFKDESRSDFPITGNLLLGAKSVKMEQPLETRFDKNYKLDVAVLGPVIDGRPAILAGIEIELTHAFDGFKGLISKTLGFPLISVDITDMDLDDITPEWAAEIIESTTLTAIEGRRKTYFYLHDLIYPQYVSYPPGLLRSKHHYLVFAPDDDIARMLSKLQELAASLGYSKSEAVVQRITDSSAQSKRQLLDLGVVVGADWEQVNAKQCLRIALDRPAGIDDLRAHQFHTAIARVLLFELNALVGYKYIAGIQNDDVEQDIWIHKKYLRFDMDPLTYRILPKRLADPISSILQLIEELQASSEDEFEDDDDSDN
jgi:hypothetical protein